MSSDIVAIPGTAHRCCYYNVVYESKTTPTVSHHDRCNRTSIRRNSSSPDWDNYKFDGTIGETKVLKRKKVAKVPRWWYGLDPENLRLRAATRLDDPRFPASRA